MKKKSYDLHYFVIKVTEDQIPRFKREVCYSFELVNCKDCRFRNKDGECTQFDAYTSAAGDAFSPPDWFYCGYGKRKETECKKTCYNCKHGAFGFDGDLGCSLWHRGKLDAKNCQFWEGAKEE